MIPFVQLIFEYVVFIQLLIKAIKGISLIFFLQKGRFYYEYGHLAAIFHGMPLFHISPNGIRMNINVIARLGFDLAFINIAAILQQLIKAIISFQITICKDNFRNYSIVIGFQIFRFTIDIFLSALF